MAAAINDREASERPKALADKYERRAALRSAISRFARGTTPE